ncbi:uncharacterized protein BP01DRAFT_100962 [Aspergillus saccharolyticus JOP 1030-1]|uniref:Uncharacterized protein n=1 Tax=Aspergillus saccharolyticus JOP 1030-1 TaxID=1450539 RepID=A0A318ZB41_9EURO|nr:hypothetical protein BP01DRAFT_100962 [Aspergillus saccharolyticus JOP 1030-1]PYH43554.1 hypothetical protein BP01DRAFT_100962 [Aspergillus saccharolyticus JOP 1030-1]
MKIDLQDCVDGGDGGVTELKRVVVVGYLLGSCNISHSKLDIAVDSQDVNVRPSAKRHARGVFNSKQGECCSHIRLPGLRGWLIVRLSNVSVRVKCQVRMTSAPDLSPLPPTRAISGDEDGVFGKKKKEMVVGAGVSAEKLKMDSRACIRDVRY